MVESLSYSCTDSTKLQHLDRLLKDVEAKFRAMLPHEGSRLTFKTCPRYPFSKEDITKVQETAPKISSLSVHSKTHHKKKDWHFKSRAGSKAIRYKKVRTIVYTYKAMCGVILLYTIQDCARSVRGTKSVHASARTTIQ